jgi:Mrp family chromosome partitioning ATPase
MKSIEKSFEILSGAWDSAQDTDGEQRSAAKQAPSEARRQGTTPVKETAGTGPRSLTREDPPFEAPRRGEDEEPPSSDPEHSGEPAYEPLEERKVNPRLVCLLDPRSEHAESYYRLRYQLETRRRSDEALVVGVTSPSSGDGKTLTGINLAGALAKDADTQVLLLDLDLRRQGDGMADYLGMASERDLGIVDWIRESGYGDEQFTHYLHQFNLHVMAAGSDPELPYELLKSSRLDDLIRRAREQYDFVIVDTPQILRLPDTELISRLVDGFVIVVKANKTGQGNLEEALNLMTPNKVIGLVFNADTESR